ncbi:MAG: glycosyltransferase family 4 protein [Candidatus Omnitrophica bacterium]|nr:glycosyltransferase family 4 protein [Candidatus Omnitrophota bacterium]
MPNNKIIISMIAYTMGDEGMCGGTRIFIEIARRWLRLEGVGINIFVTEQGYTTCIRNGLDKANYFILKGGKYKKLGLAVFYTVLTIKGALNVLSLKLQGKGAEASGAIVYSTSDFWPDAIPGWLMNRLYPRSRWIAGFYLSAPNPFDKNNPYKGKNFLRGLIFYISQYPVYLLVKIFADTVFVTSQPDVDRFITEKRGENKIIVIRGGVDCTLSDSVPEPAIKKYDAVFIGRFHPQKGVLGLLDIWRIVLAGKKEAKLLIIGYGSLQKDIEDKITALGFQNSVSMHGYVDGVEKIELLKSAKIVVHPATYDSGGMASCEAMACGLPAVSFNLESLKTYYPKGMIKTPCFNFELFAKNILNLLSNKDLFDKVRKDAIEWAHEWNWDKRVDEIFSKVIKNQRA